MFLDVSKAFVRPMVDFEFAVEVELEKQEVNGDEVTFDPVKLEGTYSMMDDMVRLEGRLSTVAHAPCAVCLADASAPVEVEFAESFRKDADEEEDGFFKYEGKQLPLDHMTLTLVLLNMPMRFKCDTECTAAAELKAWNEADTVWAEEEEEPQGTYRPFEGLQDLLDAQDDSKH